jgi:hypothetical protein
VQRRPGSTRESTLHGLASRSLLAVVVAIPTELHRYAAGLRIQVPIFDEPEPGNPLRISDLTTDRLLVPENGRVAFVSSVAPSPASKHICIYSTELSQ